MSSAEEKLRWADEKIAWLERRNGELEEQVRRAAEALRAANDALEAASDAKARAERAAWPNSSFGTDPPTPLTKARIRAAFRAIDARSGVARWQDLPPDRRGPTELDRPPLGGGFTHMDETAESMRPKVEPSRWRLMEVD